jgi:hypothetical protein
MGRLLRLLAERRGRRLRYQPIGSFYERQIEDHLRAAGHGLAPAEGAQR